tara:strand:+ start:424 stop:1983 length:1560 start_codon:yes stop_codon:yes gene_type:complete
MSYDYVIVGGGVSGLFLSYQLSKDSNKSILLVEGTNRLGGRLDTYSEGDVSMELGGARISETHTKCMNLIKEMNLDKNLIRLPSNDQIVTKIKGHKINLKNLCKEVLKGSKDYSKKYLKGVTFQQLCFDILGQEVTELMRESFGYDSEFVHLNAYSMIKMFGKDLLADSDYFILSTGFSSLINNLEMKIKDKVEIQLDTSIHDVGPNFVLVKSGKRDKKIYAHKIILCVPQKSILSYPFFQEKEFFHSVKPIPLLRIYAKYPLKKGKPWFHGLKRTITDNYIRQIIPIDYSTGLIMISYTDGDLACMWNNLAKIGPKNKELIDKLHKEIEVLFKIKPPEPEFIKVAFWNEGVHMWKAGYDMKDAYDKILHPEPKIFVANEAFSLHQCWVEGSLDMCYDVLEELEYKRTVPDRKKRAPKRTSKTFTIDEVLKKRNWMILEVKGKKRIYDVGKWLSSHPGGSGSLRKGIQANKFYKDPIKYPQSPIALWKSIPAHKSGNVMKKMLLTENEYVKYVGLLKIK